MKPYIIAEIGSNWESIKVAKKQIEAAAECGASAVKFQYFKDECLYGIKVPEFKSPCPEIELLKIFKDEAKSRSLDFLCSAFSRKGFDEINSLVNVHKIASCEATDFGLIDHAMKFGKRVMISTGGLTQSQINTIISRYPRKMLILFDCVVNYPAHPDQYDLSLIKYCKDLGISVGLSDHTMGYVTALAAQNLGSVFFEKHVDLVGVSRETPDSCVSVDAAQFYKYCSVLYGQFTNKQISQEEANNVKMYQRRQQKHGFYRPLPEVNNADQDREASL